MLSVMVMFILASTISIIKLKSFGFFVRYTIELIAYSFLTLLFFYFFSNPWINQNPKVLFIIYAMLFSKITIEIMLAHVIEEEMRVGITELWVTFFFFTITLILAEVFQKDDVKMYWIIFAMEIYSIGFGIYFSCFLISLVSKIADVLDIKVFKINEPKEVEKPHEE